jgi:tRNA(Ile2)-agmatinylcytidine synthase
MAVLRIGVDDTDSTRGMCTTFVAAVLEKRLREMGFEQVDYSHLVRLNPNCPFKTRGNASVSLHFRVGEGMAGDAVETAVKTVEEFYEKGFDTTQPGVVVYRGGAVPGDWAEFAFRAVREIVELEEAVRLAEKHGAEVYMFNGGRGVVGALAAIGLPLDNPTYEAIAYRLPSNWGTVRRVDKASVVELYETGLTFDSYDPATDEVRITPHTPCPILAGVRALTPENALKGLSMVRFYEEVLLTTVFKTNQATDMHFVETNVSSLKPYINAVLTGRVALKPVKTAGGHVFVKIDDGTGMVYLAAYRPTGRLREVVYGLRPGDVVRAMGGVKPKPQGLTLNLEKLEVLELAEHVLHRPPKCPRCMRRMESAGKSKGYRCKRCGARLGAEHAEVVVEQRSIRPGKYEVDVAARRHLSRPLCI